jgi:hypothetical protein
MTLYHFLVHAKVINTSNLCCLTFWFISIPLEHISAKLSIRDLSEDFILLGQDPDPDAFQKRDPDPAKTVRIRNAGKDDSPCSLMFTFLSSVTDPYDSNADPDDSNAGPDPTPEKSDPDPAPCKLYVTLCYKKFSE